MTSLRDRLFVLMQHGDFDAHLAAAVLDLDIADVEHALSDPNYSPPGGGGGFSLPPTLTIGDDGSLHWNDGENPSQVQLALDPVNNDDFTLALFPGNGADETTFVLYGGDANPAGTGTQAGWVYLDARNNAARVEIGSDWFGDGTSLSINADPDGAGLGVGRAGVTSGHDGSGHEAGSVSIFADPSYSGDAVPLKIGHYVGAVLGSLVADYDGSLHWGDEINPSQVFLALDPVNEGNFAVALFPENGSPNGTIFSLYGGDMQPDGTGTNSPTVYMEAGNSAVLDLTSDWFGGGPSISFRASQSSPHGTNSSFGEYNTGGHIALDTTDLTGRVTLSANGTNLGGDFTGRPALELLDNSTNAELFRLDYDGSMHWSDGTNASQIQLALDPNNEWNGALGVFPDNGNSGIATSLYGGTMAPDGTGNGGYIYSEVDGTSATSALYSAWSGGSSGVHSYAGAYAGLAVSSPVGFLGSLSTALDSPSAGLLGLQCETGYSSSIPAIGLGEYGNPYQFGINHDGSMHWGDGTNPPDVALHRAATGVLQIDQHGGGLRLTSPDGAHTKTLTIDNTGALALA